MPASAAAETLRSLGGRRLVLASASPRRHHLLRGAGLCFEIEPAHIPEHQKAGEAPRDFALRLAGEKASAVQHRLESADSEPGGTLVLAADTIVVLDGDVLGKPDDPDHALALLQRLAGREHQVITAVAVSVTRHQHRESFALASRVRMRKTSDSALRAYVAGGEPMDKAGAYGLQGEGRKLVDSVAGSESNVIGLPLEETLALLVRAAAAAVA